MVVCPTMLAAAVVPVWMTLKKFELSVLSRILLRFVPSTPISSTFGVSSARAVTACGMAAVALRRRVFRSRSSRTAASAANITGAWVGGESGAGAAPGCSSEDTTSETTLMRVGFFFGALGVPMDRRESAGADDSTSSESSWCFEARAVSDQVAPCRSAELRRTDLLDESWSRPGLFPAVSASAEDSSADFLPRLTGPADGEDALADDDEPLVADAFDGPAEATPGEEPRAIPTPRVIANAPTRPMCLAYPMGCPFDEPRPRWRGGDQYGSAGPVGGPPRARLGGDRNTNSLVIGCWCRGRIAVPHFPVNLVGRKLRH